jgi:hypothetical protein
MPRPKYFEFNGMFVPWRELLQRRKAQLAKAAKAEQPTLFPIKEDHKPASERTAAGRYREPLLFTRLEGRAKR